MLRLTFQRLGERLVDEGKALDAMVVTGDIADKNNVGGYESFLELVTALGAAKPPPNRTLVLPGNHDVASGLYPGDSHRYDEFVRFIRGADFVTPLLAGVDPLPIAAADAGKHIIAFDELQLIPIDTAAYSQVRLDVGISDVSWAALETAVSANAAELAALRKLRFADATRVPVAQLEALRELLAAVTVGPIPLRVVALHHHLLPVSAREEVKAFESFTNLGLVRQFLRDQGIAIVLHGHKHTRFTYVDDISSYDAPLDRPSSLRVVSGAAASGGDLDRTDLCRLIEIDSNSGVVQIRRVGAALPGIALTIRVPEMLTFSRPGAAESLETAGCIVIDGKSIEVVYPKLVAKVAGAPGEVDHVICRVEQSPELTDIAPLYPGLQPAPGTPDAEDEPAVAAERRLGQFCDLVRWWQFPSVPLNPWDQPSFTHGSRIRTYNGHLDQIEQVIDALAADPTTSRGIVLLLNPPADRIATKDVPFPSFCLVQFKAQQRSLPLNADPPQLECTAYFRKQEVRYWWLVNLAELALLQRQICDALNQKRVPVLRAIKPGAITTVAARAHAGRSAPKVQVPLIDRYYSLSRERLFAMANALVWAQMPGRNEYGTEWLKVFFELNPPDTSDPDGLAIAQEGLKYLQDEVKRHLPPVQPGADEPLRELHHLLEQLLAANQAFALLQQREEATVEKYNAWRATVTPLITHIIELTYGRITAVIGGVPNP